tara:strand:+ start:93 stop:332 length:240 start_codon:yes stop_codon:yes gene_type:complete
MKEFEIINNKIIKGSSYWFNVSKVDFTTRKLNDVTGEYWVKFHFSSGKEIRIVVNEDDLDEITNLFDYNINGDKNDNEL